jgi:hypothetical protein
MEQNIHNFQYILSFYYIQLLPYSSEFFSFWIENEKNSEEQPTKVMETDHVCVCVCVWGRGGTLICTKVVHLMHMSNGQQIVLSRHMPSGGL